MTVVVYFRVPFQRLQVLPDFSSQKIRQRKKSFSVISAGSSEAGERYQNSLPFPHSKAATIPSSAGRFKRLTNHLLDNAHKYFTNAL